MNWDDLKYLLAVHRKGSLSAASNELGVNQTTVTRRLGKLEQNLGLPLLKRSAGSISLTNEALQAVAHIESAEDEFFKLEKRLHQDRGLKGSLKITAVDSLIDEVLMPNIPKLLQKHPDLQLTFFGSATNLKINKFEADIAIRLARPESGTMIVSKLTDIGFAIYGTREIRQHCLSAGLHSVPWVAYEESLANIPEMNWLATSYPDVKISLKSHSATSLAKALSQNMAVGILPCFLGDTKPDLVRISGNQPILSREAWLVTHKDTYQSVRIRVAISWLKAIFSENKEFLSGNQSTILS